jgi:hypothetical protein
MDNDHFLMMEEQHVVVAAGSDQRPRVPAFPDQLEVAIQQFYAHNYRCSDHLQAGMGTREQSAMRERSSRLPRSLRRTGASGRQAACPGLARKTFRSHAGSRSGG